MHVSRAQGASKQGVQGEGPSLPQLHLETFLCVSFILLPCHRHDFIQLLGGPELFILAVKLITAPPGKFAPLLHGLGESQDPFRAEQQR